jgi:hypothetical protein
MSASYLLVLALLVAAAVACNPSSSGHRLAMHRLSSPFGLPPPPTCNLTLPIEIFATCGSCVPLLANATACGFDVEEHPSLAYLASSGLPASLVAELRRSAATSSAALVQICFVPPFNPLCAHAVFVPAAQVPTYIAAGSTLGACDPACQVSVVSFGYVNPNLCAVIIPAGTPFNTVFGSAITDSNEGQPTVFQTGVHLNAFTLTVTSGEIVTWEVFTPQLNVTSCTTINGSAGLDPCISPCLNATCFAGCVSCAQAGVLRNLIRLNTCPGTALLNSSIATILADCHVNLLCTTNCCTQDLCLLNAFTSTIVPNPLFLASSLCLTLGVADLATLSVNVTGDLSLLQASQALIVANITCQSTCTDLTGVSCSNALCGASTLNATCFASCTECAVAAIFVQVSLGSANCPNVNLVSYLIGVAALAADTLVCGTLSPCGTAPTCCPYAECVRGIAITLGAVNGDVANLVNCANGLLANPNLIVNASIASLLQATNLSCLAACSAPGGGCCLGQACFDNCFCPLSVAFLTEHSALPTSLCVPATLCPGSFDAVALATCELNCLTGTLLNGECVDACTFGCLNKTCPAVATCLTNTLNDFSSTFTTACVNPCIAGCVPVATPAGYAAMEENYLRFTPQTRYSTALLNPYSIREVAYTTVIVAPHWPAEDRRFGKLFAHKDKGSRRRIAA